MKDSDQESQNTLLRRLYATIFNGKNPKWKYYLYSYIRLRIPAWYLRRKLRSTLAKATYRSDYADILERRNYYCKLGPATAIPSDATPIADVRIKGQKVYPLDTLRFARWFDLSNKISLLPGDIIHIPQEPSIVKSRPIGDNNANSILLCLDAVRHFILLKDKIPFAQKIDKALFRGRTRGNALRTKLMEDYINSSLIDVGDVDKPGRIPEEWRVLKLTIPEQLKYKFIIALEGNDVASNLKWIMSSNSVAVMPKPKYETWFMEGRLIGGYHYIEVLPDLSDLEQKIRYYIEHPWEAEEIIAHAHEYVDQFRDPEREKITSLLTLQRYFEATGQNPI